MNSLPRLLLVLFFPALWACSRAGAEPPIATDSVPLDSIPADTVAADTTARLYGPLTEQDFIEAAERLGVDPAAIHAVVDIEAGTQHKGFWKEGYPLINFDLSIFRTMARRHNINLSKYAKSHAEVFASPNKAKYGGYSPAQQARLDKAFTIDSVTAIEGTFWGMFQIGGFNWRKCGAESAIDFAEKMARSERDQLDLFIHFLQSTGLDKHLKTKNWSAFARGYNGPSYARRGYHTRLARAYAKYNNKAKSGKK